MIMTYSKLILLILFASGVRDEGVTEEKKKVHLEVLEDVKQQ